MSMYILRALLLVATTLPALAAPQPVTVSGKPETVAITVYQRNLALIKERRQVQLAKGTQQLRLEDLPERLVPGSLFLSQGNLKILDQTLRLEQPSPRRLLERHAGKEIMLTGFPPYTKGDERITATLLAASDPPLFRIGNEITSGTPSRIIFPASAEETARPSALLWVESPTGGSTVLDTTYLSEGISWHADYVLLLNERALKGNLSGWVTVDNRSGISYQDARLQFAAGEINRARGEIAVPMAYRAAKMMDAAAPPMAAEAVGDLYLYSIERKGSLPDGEIRRFPLYASAALPYRKILTVTGQVEPYPVRMPDGGDRVPVEAAIELETRKTPGKPLPSGTVRVYTEDASENLQFAGEASVPHTPAGEKLRVKTGQPFDITASRRQTEWRKIGTNGSEASWEIVLKNASKEKVTVQVVEQFSGDWVIQSSSHPHVKRDAFTAVFTPDVPAGGETKVVFSARVQQ